MATTREKMNDLVEAIDKFVRDYETQGASDNFPLQQYKNLLQQLYDIHTEMGSNKEIHIPEGINWFHEQLKKLIDCLPQESS